MMTRLLVASIVALAASKGFSLDTLSALEWKNRVVIVFGHRVDPKLDQQINLLESQKDELADRDMVIIRVTDDGAEAVYGQATGLDASAIRKEARVSGERFHVLLVGKDGGVKLRSDSVVRNVEIFDLVDSMPMRKAEQDKNE